MLDYHLGNANGLHFDLRNSVGTPASGRQRFNVCYVCLLLTREVRCQLVNRPADGCGPEAWREKVTGEDWDVHSQQELAVPWDDIKTTLEIAVPAFALDPDEPAAPPNKTPQI